MEEKEYPSSLMTSSLLETPAEPFLPLKLLKQLWNWQSFKNIYINYHYFLYKLLFFLFFYSFFSNKSLEKGTVLNPLFNFCLFVCLIQNLEAKYTGGFRILLILERLI